jgi:hypothetical protein
MAFLTLGCTQTGNLEDLSDLPSMDLEGMPELGSFPMANSSIELGTGLPENNPFPDMPNLE